MRKRSRQSGLGTKSYLAIGCGVFALITFACCGLGTYYAWNLGASARKELVAANRDWDAGRKADAVSRYKSIIEKDLAAIPKGEKTLVFQRVIEFEIEQGQTESARSFVEKAIDQEIPVASDSKAVNGLFAQARSERERKAEEVRLRSESERAERDKRQAEERAKREVDKANAPRLSVKIIKIRPEPFRTANGLDATMIYVDWENTGNRPVRVVAANIKVVDMQGRLLHNIPPNYLIYAVMEDGSGIAPGKTYVEPNGEGHLLPPLPPGTPNRMEIEVKITRVEEAGIK